MTRQRITILNVPIDVLNKTALLAQVVAWSGETQPRTLTYVNAHCLNAAHDDPAYRAALQQADLVYCDGIGVVWAARWLTGARLCKLTGRDWINDLCVQAAGRGLSLYLLGGRPGVARLAALNLRQRYPALRVLAARDGFFSEMSEAAVLAEIERLRPDLVLVGMGVPLQDVWLAQRRASIHAPVCWAVGALFDLLAGVEIPVPPWMNVLALEWLWRLLVDPRGKWKRYLLGNPLFFLRVAREKWHFD
jgi:N-acetylglucosaminyldiphosphoundecaprenol N-acetyl-beta-D-mannosaminyltransferase